MAFGPKKKSEFQEKTIEVARVTRVVAGGKRFSFRAVVVLRDGRGPVSYTHLTLPTTPYV